MNLKIMIVDDDFINRKLIQALLKKYPDVVRDIVEAENGSEALAIIRDDNSIDLVLLDIIMPVLDGKEFLKIFRSDGANSNIPVLVLTTDDTQKSAIFDLGADDFLLKPINEDELLLKIRKWGLEA
jgi:putative two-component system response regulator